MKKIIIPIIIIFLGIVIFFNSKNKDTVLLFSINEDEISSLTSKSSFSKDQLIDFLKEKNLSSMGEESLEKIENNSDDENTYYQIINLKEYISEKDNKQVHIIPEYILSFTLENDLIKELKSIDPFDVKVLDEGGKEAGSFNGKISTHMVNEKEVNTLIFGDVLDIKGEVLNDVSFQRNYFLNN